MPRKNEAQKKRTTSEKEKTARRKTTSRANGAKSSGPKTQQGRDNISQANTRHGMKARRLNPLLIPCEDVNKLDEITVSYYEHIRPANAAEASLVDLLIASIWRGARLISYEAELLTNKAEDLHPVLDESYESISSTRLFALAFEAMNGKGSVNPVINRYLATTRNSYHSALSDIERLRKIKGDPDQPYYPPKLATEVPALDLNFATPEPAPPPEPVPGPTSEPETAAGHAHWTGYDAPPESAERSPEPGGPPPEPAAPPPAPQPEDAKPILNSYLARAVPNPDAPYSPNTIWIHLIGPTGKIVLDNYDRPILWPVHIGPEIPATPRKPAATPESTTSGETGILQPMPGNPCNLSGRELPDDLRTGN